MIQLILTTYFDMGKDFQLEDATPSELHLYKRIVRGYFIAFAVIFAILLGFGLYFGTC